MSEGNTAGSLARDARPPLALRVGVTGHRDMPETNAPALQAAVGNALMVIDRTLRAIAQRQDVGKLYAPTPPVIRLVSPLAEGADRLLAQVAIAHGWQLAVPMPFTRDEYEKDFPASTQVFAELLAHAGAEAVELDGSRDAENQAYLAVGRFVLGNSDVLIAVWNGKDAKGVGGTGQIATEAHGAGIPVIHIDTAPPHAVRLLADDAHSGPLAESDLDAVLRPVLLPEWPRGERRHLLAAETHFLRERVQSVGIKPDFLHAGPFAAPPARLSRVFPWLSRLLGGYHTAEVEAERADPPAGSSDPAVEALFLQFQRVDCLATHYADMHRSVFVLIYLLGSLSLIAAFTAQFLYGLTLLGFEPAILAVAIEGLALLFILALVLLDHHWRWRERWLDYRSLAEMLRQSDLLAQVGGVPLPCALDLLNERHPLRGWTFWMAAAVVRAAGIAGGRYDSAYLARLRHFAVHTRIADQLAYHERTAARDHTISRRLRAFSVVTFALTLAVVAAEFWLVPSAPRVLGWIAGVLPALAAVSFGIRNQAEFEIVVHRSRRARERLLRERERLSRLDGTSLSSARLHQEIAACTTLMAADVAEWAAIFEVKEAEVI
jgi:hypothetical protein